MDYFQIAISFFFLLLLCYTFRNKSGLPTNWPIVGMLPGLLINLHNINDYIMEKMEHLHLTFPFKGPWFSNMRILITVDPANVHHILSRNFANYPKGSKLKEIFDIFGDGHITTDSSLWQYHRRMAQSFLSSSSFQQNLGKKVWEKVENGLVPILDHVCKKGLEVDLQDLFSRFTFDITCTFIVGYDFNSLSLDFPSVPPSKALVDVEEVVLYRHAIPRWIWKLQRWLGVGEERKYRKAWKILDDFIYKCISRKKEEMSEKSFEKNKGNEIGDIITSYINDHQNAPNGKNDDKFLRDAILNFLTAGSDTSSITLSWLFYILLKNPLVVAKIREELAFVTKCKDEKEQYKYLSQHFGDLIDNLVYLHAALCEALRLYPPLVFEAKSPIEPDILPSGHLVDPDTQIIFHLYSMGRMKSIWGDDCNEFKPERWISEKGKIRHEPSYKFFAFNAGPRTCVGKNMAFFQMKAIAATMILKYNIQAVEGHPIVPKLSIILHMKHGFKVKVLPIN